MAVYTPPTETLPIFDNSVFPASDGTALTIATGRNYFLTYPVAQGEEIFPSNITLQSSVTDSTGSTGLSTQVLSSTVTGTQWVYSGLNGYSTYAMSSLPFTLPTTNFSNLYVLFTGTGSGTLTIPISGFTTGTFLSIKNISSGTLNISTSTILFSSTAVTTSLIALFSPYTISLYFNGSNWIQTTVSSKMNDLELTGTLTTANLIFTGALATDGITQTAGVSPVELYSTTTTKNIYFGGGLATPVHTTGPIIIGSDSTASGGINIGTGTNQTTPTVNTVNIGRSSYTTNINGTLTTTLGTLSGKTSYLELDTGVTLPALDCSTVNLNMFVLFFSGSPTSTTYTLSNIQDNQTLNFKNWCTHSTPITINFPSANFYPYGIDNGTLGASSISLDRGNSISIQRISGKIYQVSSTNNFPLGITLPSASISSAGIITGTSIVSPSYGPASNATDVTFCALSTGNINIGTGTRTTSGKDINIGNGASSSQAINIGVTGTPGTTTSIQGSINLANTSTGKPINIGTSTGLTTLNGLLTTTKNIRMPTSTTFVDIDEYLSGGISLVTHNQVGAYNLDIVGRLNKRVYIMVTGALVQTIAVPTAPLLGQVLVIRAGKTGGTITLSVVGSMNFYISSANFATPVTSVLLANISTSTWIYYNTNSWAQI